MALAKYPNLHKLQVHQGGSDYSTPDSAKVFTSCIYSRGSASGLPQHASLPRSFSAAFLWMGQLMLVNWKMIS